MLQEYLQNKYKLIPIYMDIEEEVDEKWNITKYKSEVYLEDKLLAYWYGPNKKKAQTQAAENALRDLWIIK
jgi:dsRNA-specific ribonuclease